MLAVPANAIDVVSEGTNRGAGFGSFYVPAFEIRIKDKKLPADVVRDVIQVTYKDSINEIDSFEFTVNNWDATVRDFKYAGMEGRLAANDPRAKYLGIFDPGKEVTVSMGYSGKLALMMTGQITTLEPNFPASGGSTLSVRGLNVLHQLRRKQESDFWPKNGASSVRDSDIAKDIGNKNDDKGKKRFPLPIHIDKNARRTEPDEEHVLQNNQYDIVFLLGRARRHGYVVTVREESKNGKNEKYLYFGPSDAKQIGERDVTYLLEWGKSLIHFKPTLTTAKQIGSVTVRGWDRRTKKVIKGTAKWTDLKINRDLGEIAEEFNQREEIVTNKPIHSEPQAKELAAKFLKDQLKEIIKGGGATIGLPDLRAGRKIFITGLGDRFSGTYYVIDTTHTINDSGYQTSFNARREQEGEGK